MSSKARARPIPRKRAQPKPVQWQEDRLYDADVPVGFPSIAPPRIGSLQIVDLDKDGLPDILLADMLANRVSWIRQYPAGAYSEQWISPVLPAPAHVSAVDIDKDGDLDILVACMGQLFPSNDKIGSVVILENDGKMNFTPHTIIDHIARVTDVRAADFNGDGRLDLVVGQFGYDDGETRWMENVGNWQFRSHILQSLSGVIHAIPVDIDNDGDMDIVSVVSQEWEEVYVFENDGHGNFKSHLVWGSTNEDYGSSGIRLVDLNRDGTGGYPAHQWGCLRLFASAPATVAQRPNGSRIKGISSSSTIPSASSPGRAPRLP